MTLPVWTLQDRIAKARNHAGLNQGELAEKLGVSRNTLNRWENGSRNPSVKNLQALAEVTGVPLGWFYQEDNSEPALHPPLPERITLIRDGNGYKAEL